LQKKALATAAGKDQAKLIEEILKLLEQIQRDERGED
jgi:hypothetical protein